MIDEAEKILRRCNSVDDFNNLSRADRCKLISQFGTRRLKTDNAFLRNKDSDEVKYKIFDLPKGLTCPGKTEQCSSECYQVKVEKMHKAAGRDSAILRWRKLNWLYTLQEDFVENMVRELRALRAKGQPEIRIRIHASGDFYSYQYLKDWFVICAAMKLFRKDCIFVAYTKSFEFLDSLLSNQGELNQLMCKAYGIADKSYKQGKKLGIDDFNIHIIASIMDDTKKRDRAIANKYGLPKYIVTEKRTGTLHNCTKYTCAVCSKCYQFPMEDVRTTLR